MEILNTSVEAPNIALIVLGVALLILAAFALKTSIKYLRWKANSTSFIFFIGFILLLFLGVGVIRNNVFQNRTVYDVMVKDDAALKEMKEDYEILRQSGKIYTIRKKKGILGFDKDTEEESSYAGAR